MSNTSAALVSTQAVSPLFIRTPCGNARRGDPAGGRVEHVGATTPGHPFATTFAEACFRGEWVVLRPGDAAPGPVKPSFHTCSRSRRARGHAPSLVFDITVQVRSRRRSWTE